MWVPYTCTCHKHAAHISRYLYQKYTKQHDKDSKVVEQTSGASEGAAIYALDAFPAVPG
jgi:hypothetical protein